MADIVFDFLFRGIPEFEGVENELAQILLLNEKLKNQDLENRKAAKEASTARKQAAEETRQALISELNAALGIQNAIKGEIGLIEKQRNELKLLKSAREQANNVADILKYNTAIEQGQKNLNTLTGVTDKFRGSNGFWREMTGYIAAAFATQQLYSWGEALVSNETKLESKRLALRNVLATQEEYIQSLTFLDKLSNKYGQDITVLTDTYKNFIAASQSSGLELKERQRIYEAIVKSGAALSLSNEEIEGSLRAVSQMFSKGNVQAEELRGQLGERLPGAFGLAAKALGVTESKLNDMLKAGEVLAVDLLPKLATELEKSFGDKAANNVNLIGGAFNRLSNKVKEVFGEFNQSLGITDKIAKGFNFLADNLETVVKVGTTVISTIGAYIVTTKAAAVASAAWTLIEKAGLIIKGEAILLTRQQSIANATLTETQLTAAAAAQTFNNTLLKNPIGLIVLAIGTAITAYQLYQSSVEKANEEKEKLNKQIAEGLAPLKLEQVEFNKLTKEVLDTNLATDQRNKSLDELKKRYPDQLKGITNLKDAEIKLGSVIKDVNADFIVRQKLLENEIRQIVFREQATNLIKEQIELEGKLATASTRRITSVTGTSGQVVEYKSEKEYYNEQIRLKKESVDKILAQNARLSVDAEELARKLKYQYEQDSKNAITTASNTSDKVKKIKADSAATQALIAEKTRITELEKSEVQEQKLLAIDKDIAIQRIKDGKLKAIEKSSAIFKIEGDFKQDLHKLTEKWNKIEEDAEKDTAAFINEIRANFRKINEKDERKSLEAQIKLIENKYKQEIAAINKTNDSLDSKKEQIAEVIIQEEKELLMIRNQIRFLKDMDTLHKEQSKNIQKITKDILEKWDIQDKIDNEEIAHQRELIKLYDERQKLFGDMVAAMIPEVKGLMDYNQAVNEAGRALTNFADEKLKLQKIEKDAGITSKEYLKQLEITNKAQESSVKATTESMAAQYQLLAQVIQVAFEAVKKAIVTALKNISDAYVQANKIYQDFAKTQRDAEIKAFKTDLDYKIELLGDNYDAQIDLLKGYFAEAEAVTKRTNLSAEIADEMQRATDNITKKLDYVADEIGKFSLNPIQTFKNAINIMTGAISNLARENTDSYEDIISASKRNIENLEWQKTESLRILDGLVGVYKNKYDEIIDTVKESLNTQVDELQASLGKMLDALSNWYDGQRDLITGKYDEIIENKKRLDDVYFDNHLKTLNDARYASEEIAEKEKNSQIATLKQQYTEGKITLDDYIFQVQTIEGEFYSKRIGERATFYETLRTDATNATNKEIEDLKLALKEGKITQEQYDTDLGIIQERGKQRQIDINAAIKLDRDNDLIDLKTNYLDVKVLAEQKAALDIKDANEKADKEIIRLTEEKNAKLAELAKQRRDTELQYNSDIFEQNRKMAYAQASVALAEAKANAWKNPITAPAVIRQISSAFAEIFEQIGAAVNPFHREMVGNTAEDNKNQPVEPVTPGVGDGSTGSFANGTPRLPNMNGVKGIDTQLIRANEGERIMSTTENDGLRRFFGHDLTNKQLYNYIVNPNYEMIANIGREKPQSNKEVLHELRGVNKKLGNLEQVKIINQNGYLLPIEKRSSDRMISKVKL